MFIRLNEVLRQTSLSKSTIYSMIQKGRFPKQVRLGDRSVAWVSSEIQEWINRRIESSRTGR